MATARNVLGKLKSSDGRIRVKTLSGVSALVAVIALLVGVLPVMADHDPEVSHPLVPGVDLNEGGGSGKCSVETGGLPSAAGNEFHINNPTGVHTSADGVIQVTVYNTELGETPAGSLFKFEVLKPGFVVYDVVVNGGPKSLHFDYDANGYHDVVSDEDLHAPQKNRNSLHNLSHINLCYDEPGKVLFECGEELERRQEGLFTVATVTIFGNSVWACEDKRGIFLVDNTDTETEDPYVLIDLGTGEGTVAGMATFTKEFGEGMPPFVPLRYSLTATSQPAEVSWCNIRLIKPADLVGDEDPVNPFADWLPTDKYPSLDDVTDDLDLADGAIACKVYEEEDITGTQFTVVYFEFEDPQFR